MMWHRRTRILAALAGACLGLNGAALAQDSPPRTPSTPPPPRTTDPPLRVLERDRAMTELQAAALVTGKNIIGKDVVSSSGDELGEINDLLIATKPGRVKYVVLSRGGLAGVGDTLYAIPFPAFDFDAVEKRFMLPVSEDQIKNAPKLEGTDWKMLSQEDRARQLNQYYSIDDDDERRHKVFDERDWGHKRDDAALQRWPLLKATDVRGQTLMSDEGTELGTIKDIVIDRTSGRIAFAVVSFGGTLGIGDKLVAIPWDLFDVNTEGKVFATKIDKEKVKAAPRLESDDWNEFENPDYIRNQYKHFGRDDQWLSTAARDLDDDDPSVKEGKRSGVHGKDAPYSDYDQHYAKGREGDLAGTISGVTTASDANMPRIVMISVDSQDKKNVAAHLAPEEYLRTQGIAVKPGDRVTLHGRWCDIEGKECFIVATITPASGKAVMIRRPDGTYEWR